MTSGFVHFRYEHSPCRIACAADGEWGAAEIYALGQGLVPGPKFGILFEGVVITKEEFNAMVLRLIQDSRPNT